MLPKRLVFNTAIIFLALISLNSCFFEGYDRFDRIEGEGSVVSKEIDIPRVKGIVIRNSANVSLKQGDSQRLKIDAQRNIIENLKTEVSNGILYIGNKRPVRRTKPIEVKLTLSELSLVRISGSGNIKTIDKFPDIDDIEVNISGSGNINLRIEARKVYSKIGGSGSITLDGKTREGEFIITGSGSINAYDLELKKAFARISGSGGIYIDVEDNLEARVTGSGSINYRGNPKIEKRITGSGSVRSR